MKKFAKNNFGFDLGTSQLRIYKDGNLLVETPPELQQNGKLLDKLIVEGKIARFYETELLLKQEIEKIQKPFLFFFTPGFTSLVSVPSDFNDVALRTFRDTIERIGASTCFMLNDCFIAATGLGLDMKNSASMIVDCGAGKTSITTIQQYQIVDNNILDIAGRVLDDTIRTYLSKHYGLVLDLKGAEKLKIEYADFRKNAIERVIGINGIDKQTNMPKSISIQSCEITECIRNDVELLVNRIVRHFENNKGDKMEVHLIGGGFKLKGLIDLVAVEIPVSTMSYQTNTDYMRIGFEKVLIHPEELYPKMMI